MTYISKYDSTHAIDWIDAINHDGHVKGSAKLILTNEKTGKVEQIEHDNIVTDAVKNIFRYNYNMAGSLPDLLPLKKLFGGVLLFRNPVAEPTEGMVYPWNETENPMTACAGDQSHNTRNPYRGNPNAIASEISADGRSMKQVWEWNTSQGNGTIGSLSLTSAACGNMGLKPYAYSGVNTEDYTESWLELEATNFDDNYKWSYPTAYPPIDMSTWTAEQGDCFPQIIESELTGERGLNVGLEMRNGDPTGTWTFYERQVEHPYLKVGFEAGVTDWICRQERTCKFTFTNGLWNHYRSSMFIQTSDDYYYVIAMSSGSSGGTLRINVVKIARSTMTVVENRQDTTEVTKEQNCFINAYPYVTKDTTPIGATWSFFHVAVNSFYLDENGWLYATAMDVTDSGATVTCDNAKYKLDGDGKGAYTYIGQRTRTRDTQYGMPPTLVYSRDLKQSARFVIGRNIIGQVESGYCGFYNGDMWYDTNRIPHPRGSYTDSDMRYVLFPASAPFSYPALGYSFCNNGDTGSNRKHTTGFAYSNLYLATVNSLQEQVEKTSVMGMRVEYTLNIIS